MRSEAVTKKDCDSRGSLLHWLGETMGLGRALSMSLDKHSMWERRSLADVSSTVKK